MWLCKKTSAGLVVLAGTALAQNSPPTRYCDSVTSLCYSGWTGGNGVLIGVAMPNVTVAPFETVLQIVSPIKNGWVGIAWGGTMPYVPLTIGWVNNASNTTIYSSRMAYGLSLPQPFTGAEYSYLKGTGYNTTHWTLNVRCKGCSQWADVDGKARSLDPQNATMPFAHAYASKLPAQPANNRSTFNVHSAFGHWTLDIALGKNVDFNKAVAANLIPDGPPSSSVPPTSSTSIPTTLSTSVTSPTSTPISTGIPASCSGVNALKNPALTAPGWKAVKVAGDLIQPRGVVIDSAGHLLVVQNGHGITAHEIGPNGCIKSTKDLIVQMNLNHGITLSNDGKTLYASSPTTVWSWSYDAATMTVGSTSKTIVTKMDDRGHVTRTLVFPPKYPNLLVVSHGSNDNFDFDSGDITKGRSCVKVFDISKTPDAGYVYATGGYQMGYGLRNGVGLAFDQDGMMWEIENGSDEINRTVTGKTWDIHDDNPAEEINYLGDPSKENKQWYGYPTCFSVWKPSDFTDTKLNVGDQFVLAPNNTFNDTTCAQKSTPARLLFQAHSAPLDATFSKDFTSMYVTFHGSWDRTPPTGYKVVEVPFAKGTTGFGPKAALTSTSGYKDIFYAEKVEDCSTVHCFRPVSIAKDKYERMYITSDSGGEGEIILLGKA
ncbi:cellobiose dehydrogenase-like protein [Lindgomyces ingoldianus]|uniref:Cellobiose dehydrogenase-like protein n=1 Tax=Lindgomyces ingoldianus TaxID=673940 RepID=A0ACB6QY13_9PLEO|nr:cellobiose dehydrogenase-like protein [Lindgomyces ingoldianus]KAF2471707.1 cellobiose dehydrogenase-like protein [Lindgomyces ingoldianus]